nr:EAL domain-containing protein [uncultured Caldimonas sp.]
MSSRGTSEREPPRTQTDLPIFQNHRHQIYRGWDAQREASVIVKLTAGELPSAHAIATLRHEYEMLRAVRMVGVVRALALERRGNGLALVLEDAGPQNLRERCAAGGVTLELFFEWAEQLVHIVRRLHDKPMVHRDINPSNLVWNEQTRRLTLIDFELATPFRTASIADPESADASGTWAYLSPEQTGRTGRSVDYRTDFYSIGATFYELLTGAPPFDSTDVLEVIHGHLARRPVAPHERDPKVPQLVSQIVLKLLAKAPEERYQTAAALAADLHEAARRWLVHGRIDPFQLARNDVSGELVLPERLYGREAESTALLNAFEEARNGACRFVLVGGAAGIGKTALVNHVRAAVAAERGTMISGKFDQLPQGTPYPAFVQAMQMFVRQVLVQPEPVVRRWRERLSAALADNARVVTELLPALEFLIGEPPPLPDLGPLESRTRFNLTWTAFLQACAGPEHPLVLFLDDLQWADAASVDLVQRLLDDSASAHLMVLGACRLREVEPGHALHALLEARRDTCLQLELGSLELAAVTELCADALKCERQRATGLARLLVRKTAGNPFFIRRVLQTLTQEQRIQFDRSLNLWVWDAEAIEQVEIADSAVELMVQSIERLPPATRHLVQVAACAGHQAALQLLSQASGLAAVEVARELVPALDAGLLLPLHDAFRLPRKRGPLDLRLQELAAAYRFAHDQVQRAAYTMLDEPARARLHLQLGRLLLERDSEIGSDDSLFEAVDQLNAGIQALPDLPSRVQLAHLNLRAGGKAQARAAHDAALEYFRAGLRCLPLDDASWRADEALCLVLYRESARCAQSIGEHARAEEWARHAHRYARTALEHSELLSIRLRVADISGRPQEALRWGRLALRLLGDRLPLHNASSALAQAQHELRSHLAQNPPDALTRMPEMRDETMLARVSLLTDLASPSFWSKPELLPLVMLRALNLALAHGRSTSAAYACISYATLHGLLTGDDLTGRALGRTALALARLYKEPTVTSRVLHLYGCFMSYWWEPIQQAEDYFREAQRAGLAGGDIHFAVAAHAHAVTAMWVAGQDLATVQRAAENALAVARRLGVVPQSFQVSLRLRSAQLLQGQPGAPTRFDEGEYDDAVVERLPGADSLPMRAIYQLARAEAAYLLGDEATALEAIGKGVTLSEPMGTLIERADMVAFNVLIRARSDPRGRGADRSAWRSELGAGLAQLQQWERRCAENFRHLRALAEAEIARVDGDRWRALQLYGEAADAARQQGVVHQEALANELAGRFLQAQGERRLAAFHLRVARECYRRWGAQAKVRAMEAEHPDTLRPGTAATLTSTDGLTSTGGSGTVDAVTLMRAAQALASEIELPRLLERLLRVLLETTGAERGALLLMEDDGELLLRAQGHAPADGEIECVLDPQPLDAEQLPLSLLQYVRRTREPTVLADAAGEGLFATDACVRARRIRSALCLPVLKQGQPLGLLYLENNLQTHVFTPGRAELVRHLAAQLAISLQNSLLVERLRAEVERRARTEQDLRRSQELYSAMARHFPNGAVLLFDRELRYLLAEGTGLEPAGLDREQMVGRTIWEVFGDVVAERIAPDYRRALAGEVRTDEVAYRGRVYATYCVPVRDERGEIAFGMVMTQDISERKRAEEQLQLAGKVFEGTAESIVVTDAQQTVLSVNRAFTQLTGYEPDEVQGMRHALLQSSAAPGTQPEVVHAALQHDGHWQGEVWGRRKDGGVFPQWLATTAVKNTQGEVTHYVSISYDLSERKAAEERIHFLAYYDALTQLPNRVLLLDRLAVALAKAHRHGKHVAVLFLDLDRFKYVNDSLGHAAGDELLQAVAPVLRHQLREEDTLARLGGDEFVIVLGDLPSAPDAAQVAAKVLQAVNTSYRLGEHELSVSTSIGIAVYPQDGDDAHALIKNADAAMYHAKKRGRNNYQFYRQELNERAFEHLFLETALRRGLERGEFELYYQPLVDARSGRIAGAEALIRWNRPGAGLMPPAQFIPLAEESDLILSVGDWVLREACRQNRTWQDAGLPAIPVAVNLAEASFRQPQMERMVLEVLRDSGLSPTYLELELTERTVMEDAESTIATLKQLKDAGVLLSIDDFGTGYSSLAYLKRFPIDKLKIDASFIRHVTTDADDAAITRSIVGLGHSLRLQVVAEGVETHEQLVFLRAEGCDVLQGYRFSPPLPAAEFAQLLAAGPLPLQRPSG